MTNGKTIDISNREFFKEGLQGNEFISGLQESKLEDTNVIFLSVPIFNEDHQVRGVLYGVIEPSSFEIYRDTKLADDSSNIQIIDINGEYVTSPKAVAAFSNGKNFFHVLEDAKSSVPLKEVKEQLQDGETV